MLDIREISKTFNPGTVNEKLALHKLSLHLDPGDFVTVIGGVIYYLVVVIVLWLRLNSNDLKLFTAIVVALFLAIPYWRELRISSFAKFKRKGAGKNA